MRRLCEPHRSWPGVDAHGSSSLLPSSSSSRKSCDAQLFGVGVTRSAFHPCLCQKHLAARVVRRRAAQGPPKSYPGRSAACPMSEDRPCSTRRGSHPQDTIRPCPPGWLGRRCRDGTCWPGARPGCLGMYLRTVRGETRRPSLSRSSLAIRRWPQVRLSRAICRMSPCNGIVNLLRSLRCDILVV
jgi:hypothetical protein